MKKIQEIKAKSEEYEKKVAILKNKVVTIDKKTQEDLIKNAILFAQRDLNGCSIVTYPFMPCSSCASLIIQSGIKRV